MATYRVTRALTRAAVVGGVVLGAGVGSWVTLNSGSPAFLFSPVLKGLLLVQRPFTGIAVSFDSCSGALQDGRLSFSNLRVVWRKSTSLVPQKFNCDLTFQTLIINMGSVTADMLLRDTNHFVKRLDSLDNEQEIVLDKIAASGVSGDFTMLIRHPETPLPNVQIKTLALKDVNVIVRDGFRRETPLVFPPLKIDSMLIESYHFRKPVNAVLFNAEGSGMMGEAPFAFERRKSVTATVPVQFISSKLRPPLNWVKTGSAQVKMNMAPITGATNKWNVTVSLSLKGNTEPGDLSQFGETTNLLAAYMDNKEFTLVGKQEIDEDPANEDQFIEQVNIKFVAMVVAKAVGSGVKAIAKGWF